MACGNVGGKKLKFFTCINDDLFKDLNILTDACISLQLKNVIKKKDFEECKFNHYYQTIGEIKEKEFLEDIVTVIPPSENGVEDEWFYKLHDFEANDKFRNYNIAFDFYKKGEYDQAGKYLQTFLKKNEDNVLAIRLLKELKTIQA